MTSENEKYPRIEKETLTIVFSMGRLHRYSHGWHIIVLHRTPYRKPLKAIIRSLSKAAFRLQRMFLRLQRYDIDVLRKADEKLLITDPLSPASNPASKARQANFVSLNAVQLVYLQDIKIWNLRSATAMCTDEVLQDLLRTIHCRWPNGKSVLPTALLPYWSVWDEILHHKSLLFKGKRVKLLANFQCEIIRNLDESAYQKIDWCIRSARDLVSGPKTW